MTQERTRAYGVGSPSRGQLLLTAMLRALVALVHNVVSTFQMKHKPLLRDWHTEQAHVSLPRAKSDTQQQEQQAVPQDSPIALMVSSTRSVRLEGRGRAHCLKQRALWKRTSGTRSPRRRGSSPSKQAREAHRIPLRLLDPRLRGGCVRKRTPISAPLGRASKFNIPKLAYPRDRAVMPEKKNPPSHRRRALQSRRKVQVA